MNADRGETEMERVTGVEPVSLAWEARVIPIYDTRLRKARSV